MDGNGVAGGMMPGMLGLEMPLHQHQRHHRQTPPPPALQHQHPEQLMLFASQPSRSQPHQSDADVHNAAIASKHVYPFGGGNMRPAPSSEDEPSSAFGDEYCGSGGGDQLGMTQQPPQRGVVATSVSAAATPSPWQRMKWTDTMVKLLIMVVYCVGDDGGPEGGGGGGHPHTKAAKKGSSSSAAPPCAGLQQQQQQQKKGKWKSVSRAMMEKGYYVSPQQCEDKFNDLNKRYKRVNDILGRGTACRVVENQALLDAMDHLSPKAKEEVRKLLNSKHLFFREMCAYHRSCAAAAANANAGAGAGGGDPAALQAHHLQYSCEVLTPPSDVSITQLQQQQQRCHHPSDVGSSGAFPASGAPAVPGVGREGDGGDEDGMAPDEDDDEDDDDQDEDDYGDDDDDINEDEERHHPHHRRHHEDQDEEDSKELFARSSKRQRRSSSSSPLFPSSLSPSVQSSQQQQLRVELAALTGTPEQQRQWLKWRAVELEERRVSYGRRALELEKQRFKWLRFSGNKEREMERAKLENQRLSLDTDRMLLLLRQREFDLVSSHHGGGGGQVDLRHSTTSPNGAPPTTSAA